MRDVTELTPLATTVWQSKYRLGAGTASRETSIADTLRRVSGAVAAAEAEPERWEAAFAAMLADFRFLPGGRIWAGAGSDRDVTLFNCFVAGQTGVRFLDDVIDVSRFPLERQAESARATRRIGVGITGLADALAMLGIACPIRPRAVLPGGAGVSDSVHRLPHPFGMCAMRATIHLAASFDAMPDDADAAMFARGSQGVDCTFE
jgi:ribonucleotide reductase alpha subunit